MKIKVDFLSLEKILERNHIVFSDVINIDVKNDCAVATDGYVLVVMEGVIAEKTDKVKSKEIVLNLDTIKKLKKISAIRKFKSDADFTGMDISEDKDFFKLKMYDANDEIEIKAKKERMEALEYPDWKSAVPKNEEKMLKVVFSVESLKKIIEVAEELDAEVIEFKINQNRKKPSIFELKSWFLGEVRKIWGLIMQCKGVEE